MGVRIRALVQLANRQRPVDAALNRCELAGQRGLGDVVESLFSARNVPCVTVHGDTRRARAQVDKLLAVAGPKSNNIARS